MPRHSEGPGIWLSIWRFLLSHCLYERAAEVLPRLRGCAGSHEPSLLAQAISTKFAWRGPNVHVVTSNATTIMNQFIHLFSLMYVFPDCLTWHTLDSPQIQSILDIKTPNVCIETVCFLSSTLTVQYKREVQKSNWQWFRVCFINNFIIWFYFVFFRIAVMILSFRTYRSVKTVSSVKSV